MSQVATKSIILATRRQNKVDGSAIPTLPFSTVDREDFSEYKIEVPGVDPSTVAVDFEDGFLIVKCDSGVLEIPVDPTVNVSKIKADILWGMLTVTLPSPDQPAPRSIKIALHDAVKKAPTKFTEED